MTCAPNHARADAGARKRARVRARARARAWLVPNAMGGRDLVHSLVTVSTPSALSTQLPEAPRSRRERTANSGCGRLDYAHLKLGRSVCISIVLDELTVS